MEHGRGLVIIQITQKCWLVFKFAMQPSSVCRTSRKSHRCTSSRTHLYWFRKLRGIAILYHSGSFTAVQQQSWLWFVRLPCLAKNIQPYTRPLQLRVRIKRQLCSSGKPPKVCAKQPNSRGATSRRWLSSQKFQVCTRSSSVTFRLVLMVFWIISLALPFTVILTRCFPFSKNQLLQLFIPQTVHLTDMAAVWYVSMWYELWKIKSCYLQDLRHLLPDEFSPPCCCLLGTFNLNAHLKCTP